ncbi:PEGA domain-containing protein [Methanoregula sp.]|uniref:PEGA domain-containing protein n=1 Tax=Methanoregula sp. TaxID=2052170 RepID=UPI002372260C|nr:PEGA domain-containing protein [Methanoregula sp.]MDD1685996.1 PEGA domain-containing protein [Methanoregula sp.]
MKTSAILVLIAICLLFSSVPGVAALGGGEGWITVYSNVDGAAVYLNGEYKGMTTNGDLSILVYTTGTPYTTASVEKSGYTTYTSGVTMPAEGQTTTIYATLNQIVTPTPVSYGWIYVTSQPSGAEIYFNGDYRGLAPLTISDVWPGTYTISAEKNGYRTYSTTTSVSSGSQTSVYCPLTALSTSGALYVLSSPTNSNIYLDGTYKGITPMTINNLAPGTHILEIDHAGYYDWKSSVEVPSGGTKTVDTTLNPVPASTTGWLYVSSSPGGATVTLDGSTMGETPASGSLKLNNIAIGTHTVVLTRSGYEQYSTRTSVSSNTVTEVSAILQPTTTPSGTGGLSVTSSPSGANVFLDNQFIGITPLSISTVPTGSHVVSIKMDGYQEYSVTTPVNTGAVSTVSAALTQVTPTLKSPMIPVAGFIAILGAAFIVLRRRH